MQERNLSGIAAGLKKKKQNKEETSLRTCSWLKTCQESEGSCDLIVQVLLFLLFK